MAWAGARLQQRPAEASTARCHAPRQIRSAPTFDSIPPAAGAQQRSPLEDEAHRAFEVFHPVGLAIVDDGAFVLEIRLGRRDATADDPVTPQIDAATRYPGSLHAAIRNLIHPKFGNFVLLGTVIVDAELDRDDRPIAYNPCLQCKLCVAACPVGAIGKDGSFAFSACYTHNYREFMGGFTDWAEQVADAGSAHGYRERVSDSESTSMWHSLSYGANYKAAYCMSACPAGDDVIGPFLADKPGFVSEVVKPLQQKEEPVYVVPGTDAEAHVAHRFPHKTLRYVGSSLRPSSVDGFLRSMDLVFQREKAKGLDLRIHFTFTGAEDRAATVVVENQRLDVSDGHVGEPTLRVTADSSTWIAFLRGERSILRALLTRKIRVRGPIRMLQAFGECFPDSRVVRRRGAHGAKPNTTPWLTRRGLAS